LRLGEGLLRADPPNAPGTRNASSAIVSFVGSPLGKEGKRGAGNRS
jgi:hypothetical protein